MSLLITPSISEITTESEPNNLYIQKRSALAPLSEQGHPSKEGGDLLSRIALQYHRRGRA